MMLDKLRLEKYIYKVVIPALSYDHSFDLILATLESQHSFLMWHWPYY